MYKSVCWHLDEIWFRCLFVTIAHLYWYQQTLHWLHRQSAVDATEHSGWTGNISTAHVHQWLRFTPKRWSFQIFFSFFMSFTVIVFCGKDTEVNNSQSKVGQLCWPTLKVPHCLLFLWLHTYYIPVLIQLFSSVSPTCLMQQMVRCTLKVQHIVQGVQGPSDLTLVYVAIKKKKLFIGFFTLSLQQ